MFTFLVSVVSGSNDGCFRAAVYEHIINGANELLDPNDILRPVRANLDSFEIATKTASYEDADIIVFNELSLFSTSRVKGQPNVPIRQSIRHFVEDIPDPREGQFNPCLQDDFNDRIILRRLSCMSRNYKIYVVANMGDVKTCPANEDCRDGVKMFNTQVAFDRNGNLIAKYHKYHLYGESYFDRPQKQFVYFDTDFGARIGLYICFDRVFRDPFVRLVDELNVTTMALSMYFYDEHPFLLSHQIDASWSRTHQVNILSANAKFVPTGTTGSGIFSPSHTVGYTHDTSNTGEKVNPVLVVGSLAVNPTAGNKQSCKPQTKVIDLPGKMKLSKGYSSYVTDFGVFKSVKLVEQSATNISICNRDFCCFLTYETGADSTMKNHYFAVADRQRNFAASNYAACEKSCLLVAYNNDTMTYERETDVRFNYIKMSSTLR